MIKWKSILGLTLIEILVVLLIISIVSGAVILTVGSNQDKQLNALAISLTEALQFAEEQAMLESAVLKLSIDSEAFTFFRYRALHEQEESEWVPVESRLLPKQLIPEAVKVVLQVKDAKNSQDDHQPDIIISPNGDVTPFTIYLGFKGKKPRYAITGEVDGEIKNQFLE